jgi:hypothetical protein
MLLDYFVWIMQIKMAKKFDVPTTRNLNAAEIKL